MGCMSTAPTGAEIGDFVYQLRRSFLPIILRRAEKYLDGDYYEYNIKGLVGLDIDESEYEKVFSGITIV
jgi:hypothetical protein